MNIFDLVWSVFYLYDERHDIGFPIFGASVVMSFFFILYIECFGAFLKVIGLYAMPNFSIIFFTIIICIFTLFFMMRHWNKQIREKRLSAYKEYRNKYPIKTRIRFLFFIITPIVLMIVDFTIMNIHYKLLH